MKFIEAIFAVRTALNELKEAISVYDPNADYSSEQVLIIATQVLSQAAPSVNTAIEALNRLGET